MALVSFKLLTLNVKLNNRIVRIVKVPDYYTFRHLHQLFLVLFNWDNNHLHRFEIPKAVDQSQLPPADSPLFTFAVQCMSNKYTWVSDPLSFLGNDDERDESNVTISFGFQNVDDEVNYEYDFGASWRAQIVCTQIETQQNVPIDSFTPRIIVLGGRGSTIPENPEQRSQRFDKVGLNETLREMNEFVYYPPNNLNVVAVRNDNHDESDIDQEEARLRELEAATDTLALIAKYMENIGKGQNVEENENKALTIITNALPKMGKLYGMYANASEGGDGMFYITCTMALVAVFVAITMFKRNRKNERRSILGKRSRQSDADSSASKRRKIN